MRAGFDIRTLGAYVWVHDLIAVNDDARDAALVRHRALLWRWHSDSLTGTLADPVRAFTEWSSPLTDADLHRLEPYAVLFLQWEARFPQLWRENWIFSPWSAKEGVLGTFVRRGVAAPQTQTALEDLLIGAVHRVQRCQDRWYWRLARRVDSPRLRARLRQAAEHADEVVRLRARYVLWLIEHPDEPVDSRTWRRWRRTVGVPVTVPCSASELAALPATEAAAMLVGLSTMELAAVFEASEAGPAARIAAAIQDTAVVARAVQVMDARTAARMLRVMPQPLAAELLTVMPPEMAAVRFPPPQCDQVLRLMPAAQAVVRLAAMSPKIAGDHLRRLPKTEAADFVMVMDPAAAAQALAAMADWWEPGRILASMPEDIALAYIARIPAKDRDHARWTLEMQRFRAAVSTSIGKAEQ